MNTALMRLQSELKNFGLNPQEWGLKKIREKTYKIFHVKDQRFYFLGEAHLEGTTPKWLHIQLSSL